MASTYGVSLHLEKIKTIQKSEISKDELKNHLKVIDHTDLYYVKRINNDK